MKEKNKTLYKIGKIFLIVLLLIFLFIANSFFGNPISKILVDRTADKYIENNYKDLKLIRDKTIYNFKSGTYDIHLRDENSIDSNFVLSFNKLGGLIYDTYGDRIFNTYSRFMEGLYQYGRKIEEENKFPYKITLEPIDKDSYKNILTIDEKIDFNNFPYQVKANAYGFCENPSFEEALKILKELQKIMDSSPLETEEFSIILVPEKDRKENWEAVSWVNALSIFDIKAETIRKGDLKELKHLKEVQSQEKKDKE